MTESDKAMAARCVINGTTCGASRELTCFRKRPPGSSTETTGRSPPVFRFSDGAVIDA